MFRKGTASCCPSLEMLEIARQSDVGCRLSPVDSVSGRDWTRQLRDAILRRCRNRGLLTHLSRDPTRSIAYTDLCPWDTWTRGISKMGSSSNPLAPYCTIAEYSPQVRTRFRHGFQPSKHPASSLDVKSKCQHPPTYRPLHTPSAGKAPAHW